MDRAHIPLGREHVELTHEETRQIQEAIVMAKGWTTILLCVEVGARGCIYHSWGHMHKVEQVPQSSCDASGTALQLLHLSEQEE